MGAVFRSTFLGNSSNKIRDVMICACCCELCSTWKRRMSQEPHIWSHQVDVNDLAFDIKSNSCRQSQQNEWLCCKSDM